DHLVLLAADHFVEYFALARGKRGEFLARRGAGLGAGALRGKTRLCVTQGIEDGLFLKRLLDEIDRARFHRPHRERDIGMAGHDHHWKIELHFVEPLLQLHAVHIRHLDIGNHAAGREGARGPEEPDGRWKAGDLIAARLELQAQGIPNGIVVIDDVNACLGLFHQKNSPAQGICSDRPKKTSRLVIGARPRLLESLTRFHLRRIAHFPHGQGRSLCMASTSSVLGFISMPAALAVSYHPTLRRPAAEPAASPDSLAALEGLGVVIALGRDEPLFRPGDTAEFYFKVLKGAVRSCQVLADGRRHIGEFFLAGDFIGLDAVESYAFAAEAIVDASLIRYSRRKVEALAAE